MARKGGNKKKCDKYKLSGHFEENKRRKQEQHKKHLERFAARKAEGKAYKYDRNATDKKIEQILEEEGLSKTKDYQENRERIVKEYFRPNRNSNKAKHTHYAQHTSTIRKLNDWVEQEKNSEKMKNNKLSGK